MRPLGLGGGGRAGRAGPGAKARGRLGPRSASALHHSCGPACGRQIFHPREPSYPSQSEKLVMISRERDPRRKTRRPFSRRATSLPRCSCGTFYLQRVYRPLRLLSLRFLGESVLMFSILQTRHPKALYWKRTFRRVQWPWSPRVLPSSCPSLRSCWFLAKVTQWLRNGHSA